jgi:zinc protease
MFQLIYLRFTQPRADQTAFSVMQGNMKTSLPQQRSNPGFLFSEALTSALRGDHPRTRPVTVETIAQMDLQKSMAFYKDRFADAGDFTFVFVGSFDPAEMKRWSNVISARCRPRGGRSRGRTPASATRPASSNGVSRRGSSRRAAPRSGSPAPSSTTSSRGSRSAR